MKTYATLALFAFAFLLTATAFAQGLPPVPEGDPFASLVQLITQWKTGGIQVIVSGALVLVLQAVKKFVPESDIKRKAVAIASVLYGCAQLVIGLVTQGKPFTQALLEGAVAGLFTYGGAVAIYETLKGTKVIKA